MNKIIINIKHFLFIFVLTFLLTSCNNITELEPEKVKIHYKTGALFCEGTHRVYKEGLSKKKNRIGVRTFYYPNGKISDQNEYDETGEMINSNEYDNKGLLTVSQIVQDNITKKTEYFPDGKLKSQLIETVEMETEDEEEVKIYYYTYKEYFKNGVIRELREYIGSDIQSLQVWDENEDLILEVEYENGIIKEK